MLGSHRLPHRSTIGAWFVEPSDSAAGWQPHRDNPVPPMTASGLPQTLTVGLPLTDATPLNGCMYALPAHLDEAFATGDFKIPPQVSVKVLQNIRALPAPAGSLLAWNQSLLHRGARSSRMGGGPRCSLACEFQSAALPTGSKQLLRARDVPSCNARLGLLGHLLIKYERFQPISPAIRLIAKALEWKYLDR